MKKILSNNLILLYIAPYLFITAIIPLSYYITPNHIFEYSGFVSIAFCIAFVVLASYFTYLNFKTRHPQRDQDKNILYATFRALLFIPLGYFLIGYSLYWHYNAVLYIDNGFYSNRTININGKDWLIEPTHIEKINVPVGYLTLVYDENIKKEYVIYPGNWLFNPKKFSSYVIEEVNYSKYNFSSPPQERKAEIIKDEFFRIETDFIFDVPEKIASNESGAFVAKTVLKKLN